MSLDKVLNATSVAIVGASKNETKRGYQAIKTLLDQGFEGKIYLIQNMRFFMYSQRYIKKIPGISDRSTKIDLFGNDLLNGFDRYIHIPQFRFGIGLFCSVNYTKVLNFAGIVYGNFSINRIALISIGISKRLYAL